MAAGTATKHIVCLLIVSMLTFLGAEVRVRREGEAACRNACRPTAESPDPSRFVLEGVDDLSSQVFLAFLGTLRLHRS